ncbi:short-chain dehydrogenase [Pseudozyma hubeiensis SY62]|uniref:Short-chain dehydrogenase n=1 Tax=Pseudozyma hubeiensis (strain SY62) TaxID=1305764 RepID=R9P4B6_PSEHS|nr:short-chain dehydrogenase [Pseudozyma hubeiensis SY62]GAC96097.1 short-chain dehydrogenase [Pseudozyma hubeiensis SY62]
MASVEEIKRVAAEIVAVEPRIDVLINNAGAHFESYSETQDGLESTIAVNHLAYFVLTLSLRPSLRRGSRVVNTASHLHRHTSFEKDNMDLRAGRHHGFWHGFDNYNRSKLYNVLFSRRLSQLWATSEGITVNCCHPGLIRSGFGSGQLGLFEPIFWLILQVLGRSVEAGGSVLTWLATSPQLDGVTGEYYNRFNLEAPSRDATSQANAALLWVKSLEWAKMHPNNVDRKIL